MLRGWWIVTVGVIVGGATGASAQTEGARYRGYWQGGFWDGKETTCVVQGNSLRCQNDGGSGGWQLSQCRFMNGGSSVECRMGDASHGNLEVYRGQRAN